MEQVYYDYRFRLDGQMRYLLWFTTCGDNPDGVVVAPDGAIPIFKNHAELTRYAEANGLAPLELVDSRPVDLDALARWLKCKKSKRGRGVDCAQFLDAWNLFADVSHSLGGDFDAEQERTQKIYAKLFWGNNLPPLTPAGRSYVPLWPGRELELLREVLACGLALFRGRIRRVYNGSGYVGAVPPCPPL